MRLELGTFPVREVVFGGRTHWADGVLEINRDALLEEVRKDVRITKATLELAKPAESVRIWPVRDVLEPRIKVAGPGIAYPGICGRAIQTVGQGRTHRLAGISVMEVSEVVPSGTRRKSNDVFYDMSGPWADAVPLSKLINVCFMVESDAALPVSEQNDAVHRATLLVCDRLAETTKSLDAPQTEVFELKMVDPVLPKVVYIPCLRAASPALPGATNAFVCTTATYGLSQLTAPWVLHPNEVIDGAICGPQKITSSWHIVNNPVLLELYRRHGIDLNFAGVIAVRTGSRTMEAKDLMAMQAAKVAQMLGAQGAVVSWDADGNQFIEAIRTVRACERGGIKTVLLTQEYESSPGTPTLLEALPEADAVVSVYIPPFQPQTIPAVQRVIGSRTKLVDPVQNTVVDIAGPLPAPAYNDPYGFGRLSGIEY